MILEDYGKGVLCPEVIAAALEGARRKGAPVVVDPTGRDYRRYAGSTVLTPNLKEAAIAAERPITDMESLEAAGRLLVEQTGGALAITREAEGISLFRRQQADGPIVHTHVPTVPVAVFDVTGAGDAVAATLAIALASGIEMADACALANLAGRAVVRQFGVGTISPAHLIAEANSESADWMVKLADLASARQRAREVKQAGGKVVFTNGCFDILHYGHAYLLQFARSQGDFLVLGLNTDSSVRRFKGPSRPYVSEEQRAYMLSLYPFVDLIVFFDEDTPAEPDRGDPTRRAGQGGRLHAGDRRGPRCRRVLRRQGRHLPAPGGTEHDRPGPQDQRRGTLSNARGHCRGRKLTSERNGVNEVGARLGFPLVDLDRSSTITERARTRRGRCAIAVRDRNNARGRCLVTSPTDRQPPALPGLPASLPEADQEQDAGAATRLGAGAGAGRGTPG